MSETYDRRRRTDLDLFVLALIQSGISTPYQLQKAASLSQGATTPSLHRLLKAGLVAQGKSGLRGRTDYKITPSGKRALNAGWRLLIEHGPSGNIDADLRTALLAWWIGRDRQTAAAFLQGSAEKKIGSINPDQEKIDSELPPIAYWYRRLRSASADTLIRAESDAAQTMASSLPRLSANSVRGRRASNLQK